jgi:hypothetical protein
MLSSDDLEKVRAAAASGGCADTLARVAAALAQGEPAMRIHGRAAPSIVFRPHVFARWLRPETRLAARRAGLTEPGFAAGAREQRARHAMLSRARRIDAEAACAATLWGFGRAPGDQARALGYENAQAVADEAFSGVEGQTRLLLRRIALLGLEDALRLGDWRGVAAALDDADAQTPRAPGRRLPGVGGGAAPAGPMDARSGGLTRWLGLAGGWRKSAVAP